MNRCSTCGRELEVHDYAGFNHAFCPNGCSQDGGPPVNPFASGAKVKPDLLHLSSQMDLPQPINYRGEAVAVQFKGNTICGATYEEALGKLLLQVLKYPGDQITITRQGS